PPTPSQTPAIPATQPIWDAKSRQTGLIAGHSLEEMVNTLQALQLMPLPTGHRVAVLGGAGGGSVTMTDFAEKVGLMVPQLADTTIEQLEAFIPLQGSSSKNPLDIMTVIFNEQNFYRVISLLRDDPNTDSLIFNVDPGWIYRELGRSGMYRFIGNIVESVQMLKKPLFITLDHRESPEISFIRQELQDLFNQEGIATFPDFSMTARIVNSLKKYNDFLHGLT
ncbi:MAG: hypothetical protein ABIK68_16800, partial [bacterium]